MASGYIIDWNSERGFGFVEMDGSRLFLHKRDFAERHKLPEVGDHVRFELGEDKQGRPCAKNAVHVNDGGRLSSEAIFLLLFLLIAPTSALVKLANTIPAEYLWIYAIGITTATYCVYAWDKARSRKKGKQREPEAGLHALEFLGGWPGAFVAQRRLRHKVAKPGFMVLFWTIVALHELVAIDYLRSWKLWHAVIG